MVHSLENTLHYLTVTFESTADPVVVVVVVVVVVEPVVVVVYLTSVLVSALLSLLSVITTWIFLILPYELKTLFKYLKNEPLFSNCKWPFAS